MIAGAQGELVLGAETRLHYLFRLLSVVGPTLRPSSGSGKLRHWWVALKQQGGIAAAEGQFRNKKTTRLSDSS